MKRIILAPFICFSILLCAQMGLPAQGVASPTPAGVDAAFTRLFGELKAFSADATIRAYDRSEQETVSTDMAFALSNARIRMDVDMAKLKSKHLPGGAAAALKQLGMETVVSLILPDKQSSYVIYPGLKATLKVPMKEADLQAAVGDFKLDREAIGRETLDGHPCIKYRVTITDASGTVQRALTWNATDLKDFPVQIQLLDGENLVIIRFRNVKRVVPNPVLFELPGGYTQYASQEDLMQAVMLKAMSGLGGE